MAETAPGPMHTARLDAPQIPALRRQLVEYYRTPHAALMYQLMIQTGRQQIRPPGPAARVGQLLATTEADRLARAELWHVDDDLVDLVDAAYPTMPPFAPRPFDLPSLRGFVTFARPLTCKAGAHDDATPRRVQREPVVAPAAVGARRGRPPPCRRPRSRPWRSHRMRHGRRPV